MIRWLKEMVVLVLQAIADEEVPRAPKALRRPLTKRERDEDFARRLREQHERQKRGVR